MTSLLVLTIKNLKCFSRRQNTKYKIFLFLRNILALLRENRFQRLSLCEAEISR